MCSSIGAMFSDKYFLRSRPFYIYIKYKNVIDIYDGVYLVYIFLWKSLAMWLNIEKIKFKLTYLYLIMFNY